MNEQDFKNRTKRFALRALNVCNDIPFSHKAKEIVDQLRRSSMSVGANYRAACRGRSTAEFVAKLGIVEEECDESIYWMELLIESQIKSDPEILELKKEAEEVLAMIVSSIRSIKQRRSKGNEWYKIQGMAEKK